MHALLAHAYHLALHALTSQLWRPPAASLAVALALRLLGLARSARGAALACLGAVLAGWLLLNPQWSGLHPPPLARLPGLAVILLVQAAIGSGRRPRLDWLIGLFCAGAGAWWLRGAPVAGSAILYCVPVFLGLAACLPASRWLAGNDAGGGGIAASAALAGSLMVAGAAAHWARAAVVPGLAGLVLFGLRPAAPQVAAALVMTAASAVVASDRGRLVPVDVACAAPFLAWAMVPRFFRSRPRLGWAMAAGACVWLSWAARGIG